MSDTLTVHYEAKVEVPDSVDSEELRGELRDWIAKATGASQLPIGAEDVHERFGVTRNPEDARDDLERIIGALFEDRSQDQVDNGMTVNRLMNIANEIDEKRDLDV